MPAYAGGRIEKDASGEEVFIIPMDVPRPGRFEQCWEPGPAANSRFTEAEMAKITAVAGMDLSKAMAKFAPDWKVIKCGSDMAPGLYPEKRGKKNVLVTHPLDRQTGCVLHRKVKLPVGRKTSLRLVVGNDERGDWDLIVKADGKTLLRKPISNETARGGWLELEVDLSGYAGKSVKLELINQPTDWRFEAGHWAEIELLHQ